MKLLVNLPAGFFSTPAIAPFFDGLRRDFDLRQTSCNTLEEIRPHLGWAQAVLMWSWPRIDDATLDGCPGLGFFGHIDLPQGFARTLLARGLPVSVSRRGFSPAVAEMALALILACLRRTSTYHAAMAAATETWVRSMPDDFPPLERELTGRSVGIVGFGAVGRRLGELLAPFHVDLGIHDPFLPPAVAAAAGARFLPLHELATRSDVLVLCAASNAGTHHVIDRSIIDALPPNAVFVNVARAALVDTSALTDRLRRGDLFAALDVFDREPLEADSPLRSLPNAYLTPHRAGGLMASVDRILQGLLDDLRLHVAGRTSERRFALTAAMVPALDA